MYVEQYFGSVAMALYIKHGFENRYIFNTNDNDVIANNETNDISSNSNDTSNKKKQSRKRKRSLGNDGIEILTDII